MVNIVGSSIKSVHVEWKNNIYDMSRSMCFPTMWHFDICRLR